MDKLSIIFLIALFIIISLFTFSYTLILKKEKELNYQTGR